MGSRGRTAFKILIAVQAAHSVEEYVFRLFDVFGPARFVSGLFSNDLETGFAIANTAIVMFGVWCYAARVRPEHRSGRAFAWFWAILELGNGVGHLTIAASRGAYFPGVATAPALMAVALYLAARLTAAPSRS
jgi:hypothetical protein